MRQVMTGKPVTAKPDDRLEGCMAMMAARGFRHTKVPIKKQPLFGGRLA